MITANELAERGLSVVKADNDQLRRVGYSVDIDRQDRCYSADYQGNTFHEYRNEDDAWEACQEHHAAQVLAMLEVRT